MNMRFSHMTLISSDWRKLSQFYINALDCEPTYPEVNRVGQWVEDATGIKNAKIHGINLRLPGFVDGFNGGPFLEIIQYEPSKRARKECINCPGSGQISFEVENVREIAERIMDAGAVSLGKYENIFIPGVGTMRFQFFHDPDRNILQLLRWERLK